MSRDRPSLLTRLLYGALALALVAASIQYAVHVLQSTWPYLLAAVAVALVTVAITGAMVRRWRGW